jgi:hypothetical protein
MLQLQLGVIDSVADAVGVLALSFASSLGFCFHSLLTEFLNGRKCSNCGLDCFPLGSTPFEDCRQVM